MHQEAFSKPIAHKRAKIMCQRCEFGYQEAFSKPSAHKRAKIMCQRREFGHQEIFSKPTAHRRVKSMCQRCEFGQWEKLLHLACPRCRRKPKFEEKIWAERRFVTLGLPAVL